LNELAGRIGVSDATLIRFAQELGYAGYKDFREHLADYIRKIIYSQQPSLSSPPGRASVLDRVKEADLNYLNKTLEAVNREWFQEAVELLANAKKIFCMGWRTSSFLAEFLAFQLTRLDFAAHAVTRERRTLLEQVLYCGKGDVLIVFDLLLYATEVFEAIEHVHRKNPGVKIITVTNDPLAQIVQYADLSFFLDLSGQRDFSIISLTAAMCLINAFIEGVIAQKPRQAKKALSRYENEVLSKKEHAMILKPKASA
jgi:DNA-binding MurR/RpiR family transcriptional regulator